MTSLISCDYIFMWYPQVTVIAGIQLQLNARVGATPASLREVLHSLLPLSPELSRSCSALRCTGLTSSPSTFKDTWAET